VSAFSYNNIFTLLYFTIATELQRQPLFYRRPGTRWDTSVYCTGYLLLVTEKRAMTDGGDIPEVKILYLSFQTM